MIVLYKLIEITIHRTLSINYTISTEIININFIPLCTNLSIVRKERIMAALPDSADT